MIETKKWMTIIDSKRKNNKVDVKELLEYKDLILLFVRRTFVANYKQTVLGPAWAIIQPFLTTVVYTLFFGNIAGLGPGNVPNFVFYLSGTILWSYFAGCLTKCSATFTGNASIFGKVYFPRLVMPISTMLSQLISFAIQYAFLIMFVVYFALSQNGVEPNIIILMTPVLLLQLGILGMSVGIIIASVTTKYRDLAMLVGFGTQLWSYASPVAYDMFSMGKIAPGGVYHSLYMLNPVTPIINIFRYGYLGIGMIDWKSYSISWVITLLCLVIGAKLFAKIEKVFMDTV